MGFHRLVWSKPWQDEIDHYAELATALLSTRNPGTSPNTPTQAWGLIAAKLGNKKNREEFRDVFWFTDKQKQRLGFQDILKNYVPSQTAWSEAVRAFRRADDHVEALRRERDDAFRALRDLPGIESELDQEQSHIKAAQRRLLAIRDRLSTAQEAVAAAEQEVSEGESRRRRHRDFRPGFVTALFSLGKAVSEW